MEHSGLHPEFGLFSPTRRLRRELRIAAISLLCGGIAGAICVSGVVALRHSDRVAVESAEGPGAAASQDSELSTASNTDARAASLESRAGTAAPPQGSTEVPAQRSSETSPPDVAPASAIAPKVRVVRIRKAVDSPPIARLPLGRGEAPAAASPPRQIHPGRGKPSTPPPPATMSWPPDPRKLSSDRLPGKALPIRRRRRRNKRRFALPLGAMTSRAIRSGMTSGRTIGALAPPPSMTDAARPVVHMRARVLSRPGAFGTGRDSSLPASCGLRARRLWLTHRYRPVHPNRAVAGAHVHLLASRVRMGEVPPARANPAASSVKFRACLQIRPSPRAS